MNVAQAVRDYLTAHGIKQAYLAPKCGWTKQKTSAIVLGKVFYLHNSPNNSKSDVFLNSRDEKEKEPDTFHQKHLQAPELLGTAIT